MMVLRVSCGGREFGQELTSRNAKAPFDLFCQFRVQLPDAPALCVFGQLSDLGDPKAFERRPILAGNRILHPPAAHAGLKRDQISTDLSMKEAGKRMGSLPVFGRVLRLVDDVCMGSHNPNASFSVVCCQQDF